MVLLAHMYKEQIASLIAFFFWGGGGGCFVFYYFIFSETVTLTNSICVEHKYEAHSAGLVVIKVIASFLY